MVSALIFCIAAITDWFDGFLARQRWNQEVRVSALSLDPVADKVLVASRHGAGHRGIIIIAGG